MQFTMFRIESYVTPILLSYVDKYVRDFKPEDAQVSLWGGGVALHNLVIKAEVLQQELSLPFTLTSGRIHELLIQVPWTKIMSEPIVVTIDTIECILGLNPPPTQAPPEETPGVSPNPQVVEAPPGYMQALVRKIVSNISLKVHHLIVKLVQDDIVLSLNIKHLSVSSAGMNWEPAFADIDPNAPVIRRLVRLDDLTLCLDRSDADGKIRFYLEPLLYRCQLDFRVLTRLVSVNVRRATSIALEIRSTRLAWAICNEQLLLLLRLFQDIQKTSKKRRETPAKPAAQSVPTPREPAPTAASAVASEPARSSSGSWSEWAWSWLPAWEPDESSPSPVVSGPSALPISISLRLDEIVLMYKILESDSSAARRRARCILELHLNHIIARTNLMAPTCLKIRLGLRDLTLLSQGRCVCSHLNTNAAVDEPTKYIFRGGDPIDASWKWPDDDFIEEVCETPMKAQKRLDKVLTGEPIHYKHFDSLNSSKTSSISKLSGSSKISFEQRKYHTEDSEKLNKDQNKEIPVDPSEDFWRQFDPLIYIEIGHYRSPPSLDINPYESPPADFEYSDWAEDSSIKTIVKPLNFHLRTGLLHRLQTVKDVMSRLEPVPMPVQPRLILTIEENDSLIHNLPQRRIIVQLNDCVITLFPWDHTLSERPQPKHITFEMHIPLMTVQMTSPLYPHRVCSAASQLPVSGGILFQASRLQTTFNLNSLQFYLRSENGTKKYVAKISVKLVMKQLLNKELFQINSEEVVHTSLNFKISELNICSCAARLFAVVYILQSVANQQSMPILWHSTVSRDAFCDEKQVALDFTLEELTLRAYLTKNIITAMSTVNSIKATLIHEQNENETNQAWLFSGPDTPSNNPYFRLAFQWCTSPTPVTVEYFGLWTEPTAICIDPLFAMFLSYRPVQRMTFETHQPLSAMSLNAKRRFTPPSSSGRGASKTGSGPELVHTRTRSSDSSPTSTEKPQSRDKKQKRKSTKWYRGDRLIDVYKRLQSTTFLTEIGMTMVYVTVSSATALNTVTVRDAMEMHATTSNLVTVFGLGILTMGSNPDSQVLWQDIRNDGPTLLLDTMNSFPWRVTLADVTCYTLEAQPKIDSSGRDKAARVLRSKLKVPLIVTPNNILDLVSTTVMVTVVTKKAKIAKTNVKHGKDGDKKGAGKKHGKAAKEDDEGDQQIDYFSSGIDFTPSTLKEFLRGPADRKRKMMNQVIDETPSTVTVTSGPIVSFGINVHADTPPIILRLDYDQVMMLTSSLHCLKHVLTMINDSKQLMKQHDFLSSQRGMQTSQTRSVSDVIEDESSSEDSEVENKKKESELISIFESAPQMSPNTMKKFFWFQWVISRATLVITTATVKLMIDVDDIIATVDMQRVYNQYKLKLTSLSVRHQERIAPDEWKAGVMNGRILEVREPTTVKEDTYFLSVTVTQAWVTNLPESWKDVLHPRILNKKSVGGSIWEIYATVAPLEIMLRPSIMDMLLILSKDMALQSECPIRVQLEPQTSTPRQGVELPLCYLSAGGVRIIVTGDIISEESVENVAKTQPKTPDDTFIFQIGKITINPHPDNPIIRRAVSTHMESTWSPSNIGAQYELMVKGIGMKSTVFHQIMTQEARDAKLLKAGTGGVNPAFQWGQPHFQPMYTTVLHAVNVSCVYAPANYNREGLLTHGPAIEFNIVTDCNIEISMRQLILGKRLVTETVRACDSRMESCYSLCLFQDKPERLDICPYADPLKIQENALHHSRYHSDCVYDKVAVEEPGRSVSPVDLNKSADNHSSSTMDPAMAVDSGVQTTYTQSSITHRLSRSDLKKQASVGFFKSHEQGQDASQYLEIFVTTGMIELSFYCSDEMTQDYSVLKIPKDESQKETNKEEIPTENDENQDKGSTQSLDNRRRSLTELDREMPGAVVQGRMMIQHAKRLAGNIPLLNMSLHQPNLYYWKRKSQKTLQASLYDAWVGLGAGKDEGYWHKGLLSTARGPLDPHTGVAPSLATIRLKDAGGITSTSRAALTIDIERPILFEICSDRMKRLNNIIKLLKAELLPVTEDLMSSGSEEQDKTHPLLSLRRLLVSKNIGSVTLQTTQVSLGGYYGSVGFDAFSVQATTGARPEKIDATCLLTALFVAAGKNAMDKTQNTRNFVLQPFTFGTEFEAVWDSWRKVEGGSQPDPTIHVCVEMDYITLDFRPEDLELVAKIRNAFHDALGKNVLRDNDSYDSTSYTATNKSSYKEANRPHNVSTNEYCDHYFKDDLRTGAFRLVRGSRAVIPAPYQIAVVDDCVTWRYPQPRAIANITVHPVPMEFQDEETDCVLEVYMPLIGTWEAHTYFKTQVENIAEYNCTTYNTEAIFATTWRYRILTSESEAESRKFYEFDVTKYLPKSDSGTPLTDVSEPESSPSPRASACKLVGSVSVDSYIAPSSVPKLNLSLRCAGADIYVYNDLPNFHNKSAYFIGYYLTKSMCRNHRTLAVALRNTIIHASPESQILVNTNIESDIFDCTTGLMVPFVEEFRVQAVVVPLKKNSLGPKLRGRCSQIRVALHIHKIDILKMLADDWKNAAQKHLQGIVPVNPPELEDENDRTVAGTIATLLRGRISLWIHNSSAFAIRIGQDGSDESFTLEPGARFAYRWYNPDLSKKLHFASGSAQDENVVTWSTGIPFTVGKYRVVLGDHSSSVVPGSQLHVKVHEYSSNLYMTLYGRLTLANILRVPFQYKVRQRGMDGNWSTIIIGELPPESVGQSVLCSSEANMLLKIKFKSTASTAWSGDIPLHECPKENVPWLVKVPDEGDLPYLSVWCRVSRGRADDRLLAAIWPLYVLRSNLPLDADVTIATELVVTPSSHELAPPPVVQGVLGRGLVSHLHTVGTTAARHNLSFQYRLIDCPVTPIAVPLHYGMTEASVFTKQGPIQYVDSIIDDIYNWLNQAGRGAKSEWPYSQVKKHWPYQIQPAMMQPCSDVTVHYSPVRAGGGCSLEISLCPLVILCNGSSIGLTLRAHDASPLCKLEPGIALSPPSIILTKPFYISVERGKDTFVSAELSVYGSEPGEYEKPPAGCVALKKPANFSILCCNKLAPFSLYYEIVDGMNILGISSTYVFVNRLNEDIKISGLAVPEDMSSRILLRPKTYKTISPTTNTSNVHGTALSRLFVYGRLIGTEPSKLRSFVCLALEGSHLNDEEYTPLAIRLDRPPRKPAFLINKMGESVAIVVTQVHQEGRIIVTVSYDPCPQFLFHNRSKLSLAIGEAAAVTDNNYMPCPELHGATWHCVAPPSHAVHYSTPSHAARFPPASEPPSTLPYAQLTFAVVNESIQNINNWSAPVFVTKGEQLLKLNNCTVKLRVTSHPHSTLLEIRDVGTDDISASDIRKRLMQSRMYDKSAHNFIPHRIGASDKLPVPKGGRWSLPEIDLTTSNPNTNMAQTSAIPQQNITQYNVQENSYLNFLDKRSGTWRRTNNASEQSDQTQPSPGLCSETAQHILEDVVEEAVENQTRTNEICHTAPQAVINALSNIIMMSTPDPEPALNPEPEPNPQPTSNPQLTSNPETAFNPEPEPNLEPSSNPQPTSNSQPASNPEPVPNPEPAPDPEPEQYSEPPSNPHPTSNSQLASNPEPAPNAKPAPNPELVQYSGPPSNSQLESNPGPNTEQEPDPEDITDKPASESTHTIVIQAVKVDEPSITKPTTSYISIPEPVVVSIKSVSKAVQNKVDSVNKIAVEPYTDDLRPLSEDHIPLIKDNPMIDILDEQDSTMNNVQPTGDFVSDLKIIKNCDSRVEIKLSFSEQGRRDSAKPSNDDANSIMNDFSSTDWRDTMYGWRDLERVRFVVSGIVLELARDEATPPLIAAYVDRAHILLANDDQRIRGTLTVADIQVDNLQHNTGQFDFPVIASTRIVPLEEDKWPPICSFFFETDSFSSKQEQARLLLKTCFDKWTVLDKHFCELSEVDARLGPLSLCIEDAFVTSAASLLKSAAIRSEPEAAPAASETRALVAPLRLRSLNVQPLDLTLTLHTAVRMYIALDHSPLRLSAFEVRDMMTSLERLTHALTVHYLSAAILGAGWMVGGLELLGAPGALAARVGGATGGVRGVASAAAAALLRSLSAWASSLARNLDIIAGDEEHSRRAAAARRQLPDTFIAGITAGLTNLVVNMLGAVGGLAHHPLVGVATGETDSGVEAIRRSLLGAVTKPLSATADLLAFAGHGLLAQTGWDPEPQARCVGRVFSAPQRGLSWRRDCSRWRFTADAALVCGADVLLDHKPVRLLVSNHLLVIVDPHSDKIIEMVNLSNCNITPYAGAIIELRILTKRQKSGLVIVNTEDEEQVSQAAMARVARFTGAATPGGGGVTAESRTLVILPPTGRSLSLYALLVTAIHHSQECYCNTL